MLATVIISIILAFLVGLAIRSVVKSRRKGVCSACGDDSSCAACKGKFDL